MDMEKSRGAYKEQFAKGSRVKIADSSFLDEFLRTWKFHHKLRPEQLSYTDKIANVKAVGFYHGGDVLYELRGVPALWHERCLRPVERKGFFRRFFGY